MSDTKKVEVPSGEAKKHERRKSSVTFESRYIHLYPSGAPELSEEDRRSWASHKICRTCTAEAEGQREHKFSTNYVSTTKYHLFTFPFQNLFEQFHKKANLYFLLIAIISATPISPKPALVSIAPLVFVLAVTMVKEAIEDYRRYEMDKEVNNRLVKVWRGQMWIDVPWHELLVGDLVRVLEDQSFPADICLLKSSAPSGACSIDTANLDGETNLKVRKAQPDTFNIECASNGSDYFRKSGGFGACVIESSPPSKSLASSAWTGRLSWLTSLSTGKSKHVSLSMSQMLLRGCTLRSTKWIIGVVVMTGGDTKLVLNSSPPKFKRSRVDRIVDQALYVIFAMQAILCTFGAVGNYLWLTNNASKHWYLPFAYEDTSGGFGQEAAASWLTYLVLLDIFVPISLYVSMELVKITQAYLINQDLDMYYEKTDVPAAARTSNLNEELGQVKYIFSDKTGTLTANIMNFIAASVDGHLYGDVGTISESSSTDSVERTKGLPPLFDIPFHDQRLQQAVFSEGKDRQAKIAKEFLTLLATCHTVMADFPNCKTEHVHGGEGVDCKGLPKYQAASPDEKALVIAACNNQYYFYNNSPQKLTCGGTTIHGSVSRLNIRGVHHTFEVLEQFKFTSARARMSVIVRDPRDGLIKLYCKGSDAKMRPLLNEEAFAGARGEASLWDRTGVHLDSMAKIGLRTLVCAYKVIPESEFLTWYAAHKAATEAVKDRDALVGASMDRIETGLTLLGATAIEDKLQDGVPEAIAVLARAHIKIWVLTGDKVETAINVSKAANLLTPAMEKNGYIMLEVSDDLPDKKARALTLELLEKAKKVVDAADSNPEEMAVIVSGGALNHVFPNRRKDPITGKVKPWSPEQKEAIDDIQSRFNSVCQNCKAVVCCRVSPNQKAEIVNLVVRFVPGVVTLAIGDGANDVSMIKAAHVGIGISGFEGLQAVMASDYAIGQFKFLEKLLLVHGQWSYRRISVLILYSFYKNAFVAILHVYFAFYSSFSAQIFYDAFIGSGYNIFFTSFPVMLAAVFNKETTAKSTLAYPFLYMSGQNDECFNLLLLFKNIGLALFQSLLFYFLIVGTYGGASVEDAGYEIDHWVMSTSAYSGAVLVANMNIALHTTTWNGWSFFFWIGSILVWFLFFIFYANLNITPDVYGVPQRLFSTGHFWLVQILGTFVCTMPDLVAKFVKKQYYPSLRDIVAEKDKGYGPKDGSDLAEFDSIIPRSGTFKDAIELKQGTERRDSTVETTPSGSTTTIDSSKRVRTGSENESRQANISTHRLNIPNVTVGPEQLTPNPVQSNLNPGELSQPPSPSTSNRSTPELDSEAGAI